MYSDVGACSEQRGITSVDPQEAERLLQYEIRYWRRELTRAYAKSLEESCDLLAVSRRLDDLLQRYQAAFAGRISISDSRPLGSNASQ